MIDEHIRFYQLIRERLPSETYRIGTASDVQLALDLIEHTDRLYTQEEIEQAERDSSSISFDNGKDEGIEETWGDIDRVLMEPLTDEQKLARIKLLSGLPR